MNGNMAGKAYASGCWTTVEVAMSRMRRVAMLALVLVALLGPSLAGAAPSAHVPDELLVRFRPGASSASRTTLHAATGATVVRQFATIPDLQLIKLPPGLSMARAHDTTAAARTCCTSSANRVVKLPGCRTTRASSRPTPACGD